jgi:2-polyprenyl-6-hydroxyphenyl methylase/3-demethylubiquinone-9 3-methyltransferase
VVLALEIVEHVADVDAFVRHCHALCKPGGLIIFSTLNRTPKSYLLGKLAAEYVLRWVPAGTHDWKKFIKPSELARAIRHAGGTPLGTCGMAFDPIKGSFKLSDSDLSVNYFMDVKNAG